MTTSQLKHTDVFVSGTDGYCALRIPAIETAADGSLLAFAEARKYTRQDPGGEGQEIDLVMKRSTDGGDTWSAMITIEALGELRSSANPATVLDRQTGVVWMFYMRCRPECNAIRARAGTHDIQILARSSRDNGLTWSEPDDLTEATRDFADDSWTCTVVGPGGAIQDRHGRLVAAAWKSPPPRRDFAVISEDHGETWQRGEGVPGGIGGNENQIVELVDGRLLMDFRQDAGEHRWISVSSDGGRSWGDPRPGVNVTTIAAAIKRLTLKSEGADRDRILWTGPEGQGRERLVARLSYDEGQTFGEGRLIYDKCSAYSDLTLLADGAAGVFWERGVEGGYEYLTFTKLPMDFLEPADNA